jgi:hypothetical protein
MLGPAGVIWHHLCSIGIDANANQKPREENIPSHEGFATFYVMIGQANIADCSPK